MKKKPLILVIDDEIAVVDELKRHIVDKLGWKMISAHNGKEGLKLLTQHKTWAGLGKNKIDCVILDVKMPVMNGPEMLMKWRKKEGFYESMPFILLSAYEDKEIWTHATNVLVGRVSEYLQKPWDNQQLIDTLQNIVINQTGEFMSDNLRNKSYQRKQNLSEIKSEWK
tara:strand:- start:426 stop:929 length:504 start_codon:yes stop_codon:yes gene_type:complete